MATHHVHASIDGLLKLSNQKLAEMFNTNGAAVRLDLKLQKGKGHLYIGSENCEGFDPVKGCPGHENEDTQQDQYDELKAKYDAILATADGHSSQTENVWQSGYAAGHDVGYERGKRETRSGAVWVHANSPDIKNGDYVAKFRPPGMNLQHDFVGMAFVSDAYIRFVCPTQYDNTWQKGHEELQYIQILDESGAAAVENPEPFTEADADFMRECDLYPTLNGTAKILTENDEGACLDKVELMKLAQAIIRFVNHA